MGEGGIDEEMDGGEIEEISGAVGSIGIFFD